MKFILTQSALLEENEVECEYHCDYVGLWARDSQIEPVGDSSGTDSVQSGTMSPESTEDSGIDDVEYRTKEQKRIRSIT